MPSFSRRFGEHTCVAKDTTRQRGTENAGKRRGAGTLAAWAWSGPSISMTRSHAWQAPNQPFPGLRAQSRSAGRGNTSNRRSHTSPLTSASDHVLCSPLSTTTVHALFCSSHAVMSDETEDSKQCRICLDGEVPELGRLIRPCLCKGSISVSYCIARRDVEERYTQTLCCNLSSSYT